MIYKHKNFIVDLKSRKVFDENKKELRLTGNAYRVLVFLCKSESATVTDIGDHLDFAKDYDENHIRQYRYKINTIIGHDVVEYKNGVYSLVGKIEEDDRITDLLQGDDVELKGMKKKNKLEFYIWPGIIAIVLLLLTFFPWPYSYFTLLRWIVTAIAVYYAYFLYEKHKKTDFWFWVFVGIAILFNPIVPVYLYSKAMWGVIDVIVAVCFGVFIIKNKK